MRIDWTKEVPDGYQAMKDLDRFGEQSKLEPLLKELIRIRVSQINGCAFCLDMHTKDARALGETEQRIHVLAAWREVSSLYNPRERAALAWAESLTLLSQKGVPDEIYVHLESLFSPDEIIALTFVITAINSWNRFLVAFQVEIKNYVSRKKPAE
jgi:AhpD family alkylhydroperoxidase